MEDLQNIHIKIEGKDKVEAQEAAKRDGFFGLGTWVKWLMKERNRKTKEKG